MGEHSGIQANARHATRELIMRINPFFYGILVLSIFLGTIFGFQAAGVWSVSGKLIADGTPIQPSAADVDTIKGWMDLEQITTTYDVPLAEILEQFDLPADTPTATAIKDLESDLFSVTELRAWLLNRIGSEQQDESDTASGLVPPTTTTSVSTPIPETPPINPTPTLHVAADQIITGRTTFQDLLDWGIPRETIQVIIGDDLPSASLVIKDYVTQKGLDFLPIKTGLQEALDR
jgi:hypothetical protein